MQDSLHEPVQVAVLDPVGLDEFPRSFTFRCARSSRIGALLISFPSLIFSLTLAAYVLLTWLRAALLSRQSLPGIADLPSWAGVFERSWSHHDSFYFLQIAQEGYTTQHLGAFFPLYPLLIRLVAWPLGNHFTLAALLVSWLCGWGSYCWSYRLVQREYGERVARLALLFLVCYPMSVFTFAAYSEALFLLVSIGAVERARAGRLWQAGVLGALAMLTRPTGIVLLIPLGWEWARQSRLLDAFPPRLRMPWLDRRVPADLPFASEKHQVRHAPPRLTWLALMLIPLALLGYMGVLGVATGNPLAFLSSESTWNRHLRPPWQTADLFVMAFQHAWQTQDVLLALGNGGDLLLTIPLPLVLLYLSLRRRAIWPGAAFYYLGLAIMLLSIPIDPKPPFYEVLLSTQRLLLPAFPLFLVLGRLGAKCPRLGWLLLLISLFLLGWNTWTFVGGHFVA